MTHQLPTKAQPIQNLDFIRGLALLGMLLSNAQTGSLFVFLQAQPTYAMPMERAHSDPAAQFFSQLLVNGPFTGLFTVGFSWCFYGRWKMDQQTGLDAGRLARRGLSALLLLGLLNGLVGWLEDLLQLYALPGFTLVYFVHQSVSTLLRWIAGLVGVGVLIQLIAFGVVPHWSPALAAPDPSVDALMKQFVNLWQHGSFLEIMGLQPAYGLLGHTRSMGQGVALYVHLEILLLVGLLVGKLGPFYRLAEVRVRLSLLLLFMFPLAIGLKGVSSLFVVASPLLPARWQFYQPLLFSICDFLGTPLLTGVYLLEIGLNRRPIPHRVAVWVSQAGQMSLTNYLLQSGLSRLLFDEHSLGLAGKLTFLESVGVVLLIYSLQLGYSHWWLSRYQRGPVEQLLNWWTYRKKVAKPSASVRNG